MVSRSKGITTPKAHYLLRKKKKNTGHYTLKKNAWEAVSAHIRRTEPLCILCGAPTTEAAHFIHNGDKTNKNLKGNELWYDLRNIHGNCTRCNHFKSGNTIEYALWMEKKYGEGIIQELWKLYKTKKRWTKEELVRVASRKV